MENIAELHTALAAGEVIEIPAALTLLARSVSDSEDRNVLYELIANRENYDDAEVLVTINQLLNGLTTKHTTPPQQTMLSREITHQELIRLKEVTKNYGGNFSLRVDELSIWSGKLLGIVGENANGKTTLLNLLAGALAPTDGTIEYFDGRRQRVDIHEFKRVMGFLEAEADIVDVPIRQALEYTCYARSMSRQETVTQVQYIAHKLGIVDKLDQWYTELSTGYRARVRIALALVWKPRILILDEPTANLDFLATNSLLNELYSLARSSINPLAIVISSQDIRKVEKYADSVLVLKNGEQVYHGGVADIGAGFDGRLYSLLFFNNVEARLFAETIDKRGVCTFAGDKELQIRTELDAFAVWAVLAEHKINVKQFTDLSSSSERFMIK